MSEVRVRFAPSPTGHLHVGGARTALFNYYFAKAKQGKFILRIEDTDKERSLKEHEDEILSSLKWLGLNWDEGPFYQSERESLYKEKLNWLLDQGHAYRCDCTPEEIDQMREAARAKGEKPKYNGRCRERKLPADHDKPFVVRFKAPQGGVTRFEDFIAGQVEVDQSEGDDFIIARSDGSPTYQFVVVVDDIDMGVTHVIRGEDHLSNTYKQVQLYEAFQAKASLFAHVPIILGPDKSKLSKRHGAVSLSAFKEQGILSEAMRNALVRLGWSHGDQELFTDEELKKYFDLDHCGRSAAMFDHEKLGFYNSHFCQEKNYFKNHFYEFHS